MFLVQISKRQFIDASKISQININQYVTLTVDGVGFEVEGGFVGSTLEAINRLNNESSSSVTLEK